MTDEDIALKKKIQRLQDEADEIERRKRRDETDALTTAITLAEMGIGVAGLFGGDHSSGSTGFDPGSSGGDFSGGGGDFGGGGSSSDF